MRYHWKFVFPIKVLINSLTKEFGFIYSLHYQMTNHSPPLTRLWLVALIFCRGKFFKVDGQQPNFQELLYLHPLSALLRAPPDPKHEKVMFCYYPYIVWNNVPKFLENCASSFWVMCLCMCIMRCHHLGGYHSGGRGLIN